MSDNTVVVSGGFDDLRATHVRCLEEAAKLGPLHVLLWSDEVMRNIEGQEPRFPEVERQYLLGAIRYVNRLSLCRNPGGRDGLELPDGLRPKTWVVDESDDTDAKRAYCRKHGFDYHVVLRETCQRFPVGPSDLPESSPRKRVIVTGCFDWFHSGHARFFEEASELGDLYVVVGHDANIRLLKGDGHPMFSENQRCYMIQSIRHVKQALVSTGHGWLDAEPEIERIRPHIYAVNEDGDRPEKRVYCESHGIEYRVLERVPREGLPQRQSTALRGF